MFNFTASNIVGIPETERQPIVNLLTIQLDVDNSGVSTAARAYQGQQSYEQQTSLQLYRQVYEQQVEATGLRTAFGGSMRSRALADRVFRRHAFAPPAYRVRAHLAAAAVELGDLVSITHPWLIDFETGGRGVVSVVCEVIDRRPNYALGYMEFSLLDTRFLNEAVPYQIAPATAGVPAWPQASEAQRQQYMFVWPASPDGAMSGAAANTIF